MKLLRPRNPKLAGERAECAFLHAALDRGFIVAKPWGDSYSYDFIVDSGPAHGRRKRKLSLVQVRSVGVKGGWGYRIKTAHHRDHAPMTTADADLIAALVVPFGAWYIIPMSAVPPGKMIILYPHNKHSRGRYEKFRDAWWLLDCGSTETT